MLEKRDVPLETLEDICKRLDILMNQEDSNVPSVEELLDVFYTEADSDKS